MYIFREIIQSPWFYWPLGGLPLLVLIIAIREGDRLDLAWVIWTLVQAFFLAFAISGMHRLFSRFRDRGL